MFYICNQINSSKRKNTEVKHSDKHTVAVQRGWWNEFHWSQPDSTRLENSTVFRSQEKTDLLPLLSLHRMKEKSGLKYPGQFLSLYLMIFPKDVIFECLISQYQFWEAIKHACVCVCIVYIHIYLSCVYAYLHNIWLPRWCSGKESTCQCQRLKTPGFDPWVGKIPGVGSGDSLRYSCLENSMDRGAWRATVHAVTSSQAWLSNWACTHTQYIIYAYIIIFIYTKVLYKYIY